MNNRKPLKIFITREAVWGDMFAVRMGVETSNGNWAIAQNVDFKVEEQEGTETRPAMMLTRDDAQAFMDELWNVGVRPSEGTGSAGSLAATERHLADMRALVFKTPPK